MTAFDRVLLDGTERFCRQFQRLTGRTNVWLAVQLTNVSIIVYFVWAGLHIVESDLTSRFVLGLFCAGLLYLLSQTIFKVSIEVSESSAYRRVARGLRNPRRIRDALLRIVFLTSSVLLLYPTFVIYVYLDLHLVLLTHSLFVLTTVLLYVLACDPLPPCVGTLTERLLGSRASLPPHSRSETLRPPARVVTEGRNQERSFRDPVLRYSSRRSSAEQRS